MTNLVYWLIWVSYNKNKRNNNLIDNNNSIMYSFIYVNNMLVCVSFWVLTQFRYFVQTLILFRLINNKIVGIEIFKMIFYHIGIFSTFGYL